MAAKKIVEAIIESKVIESSIESVMHNSMMPYSEHVILDRALPRVEDGLKPVQRRILYAMLELGVTPDKQHRKSARIVGDCLGKYHPHGDSSVYDAMVRMAQDFNMRMCLVDGHGNFGSVDGDSAAAMRYTEARLTPLAMEMLRDLEKNTVKWSYNFDDTLKEPCVLPSRFPNLLVNGSSGIAVGLATNIPPHNLTEVIDGAIAFIDNPRISLVNMMKYIKGPDFPTGGHIIGGEELFNAYLTGKGKIKIRAKAQVEIDTSGKQAIVITELPYQTNKANLLIKINEQRELRKQIFADITDIVDETDRNGMRAIIKLKKEAKAKKILEALYKYTGLEITFGINMVALAGGKPQQLGLLEMLRHYVDFQRSIIHKRTMFDLAAAKAREHILDGLIIAIKNIDAIIKLIKASKNLTEAKLGLREKFSLSEKQAQAIVDMRLGRLTMLEIDKLRDEIAELKAQIKEFEYILSSTKHELDVVKKELLAIKKTFKTERKSDFLHSAMVAVEVMDANIKDEKEGVVVLGASGDLKLVSARGFASANIDANNFNAYELYKYGVKADNKAALSVFTNLGNVLMLDIDNLEEKKFKSKGLELDKLSKDALKGEYAVAVFSQNQLSDKRIMFFTKSGMIKCTSAAEYSLGKNYYQAMILKDDEVIGVELASEDKTLMMVSQCGMVLNASIDDVPLQGRKSGGVKGFQLAEGDSVVFAKQVDDEGELLLVTQNGFGKRIIVADIEKSKRYRKGLRYIEMGGGDKVAFAEIVKESYHIAFLFESDSVTIHTDDLRIATRVSKAKDLLTNVSGTVVAIRALKNHKTL